MDGDTIAEKPSHEDLLERVKDAYERALAAQFDNAGALWVARDAAKRLLRQAIEQAFDNGHACAHENGC